jgi:hypothetical protein
MIETPSAGSSLGSGRAAIQYVSESKLNGQMLPSQPFRNVERSGTCFGNRMRACEVTVSKPASSSRLRTSCGDTQLRSGLRGFSRSASASLTIGRQARLYELMTTRVRSCECAATRSNSSSRSWT